MMKPLFSASVKRAAFARGISPTTISLFLSGKRTLRPAMAVRLVDGLERAFVRNGSRLDTAFFANDFKG